MKKLLTILLSLMILMGLAACNSGSSTPSGEGDAAGKSYKIGVVEVMLNDESVIRSKYFKEYIGPKYNVEFMFSEACTDLDSVMKFVENAAVSGCDAILNYYAVGANSEQLALLCQEKGMILVENGGRNPANEAAYVNYTDTYAGGFMADQPDTGRLFKEYLEANLDPSVEHNFIVGTGGAYQGNAQQTEISINMLTALQDVYGLKYDKTIQELIESSSPIEATNDKGIAIYCYPGHATAEGWLPGLSAALQTGTYDYVLMSGNVIGNIGTVISEAEAVLNKDITVVGFGSFGDALSNAMHTLDQFGNPTVSMSTVKFTTLVSAMGFAKAYNALTGHNEVNIDTDGAAFTHLFRMNAVTSAAELDEMGSWDKDNDSWVADYSVVDSFLAEKTPGLTAQQFQENIYAVNYESIKARMQ